MATVALEFPSTDDKFSGNFFARQAKQRIEKMQSPARNLIELFIILIIQNGIVFNI